jgi:hypothetical protein
MTTTQNTFKNAFRFGTMVDANGNLFSFELNVRNRGNHFTVELEIFRGNRKAGNSVSSEKLVAMSLESARNMWKTQWAALNAAYTMHTWENYVKHAGVDAVVTTWEAKPEGGIRKLVASFHDGNEGSYSLTADFVAMTLTKSGTDCPDIPAEVTVFPIAGDAKGLDDVFQRAVKTFTKRYYPAGVTMVAMNWVTIHTDVDGEVVK